MPIGAPVIDGDDLQSANRYGGFRSTAAPSTQATSGPRAGAPVIVREIPRGALREPVTPTPRRSPTAVLTRATKRGQRCWRNVEHPESRELRTLPREIAGFCDILNRSPASRRPAPGRAHTRFPPSVDDRLPQGG